MFLIIAKSIYFATLQRKVIKTKNEYFPRIIQNDYLKGCDWMKQLNDLETLLILIVLAMLLLLLLKVAKQINKSLG